MIVNTTAEHGSPRRPTLGLFISLSSLMHKVLKPRRRTRNDTVFVSQDGDVNEGPKKRKLPPKSPMILARSKQLLMQISNRFVPHQSQEKLEGEGEEEEDEWGQQEGFGDGGVWQKEILMGDKCQPLDFSGVICYDSQGKLLNKVPPRQSIAGLLDTPSTQLLKFENKISSTNMLHKFKSSS